MNPQPSPMIGNICATLFILLFLFYTYQAYSSGKTIDLSNIDLINVGYLERENINIINTNITTPANSFESQQLYLDCIDVLHSMGMKKSEAKKKAKFIFSTVNPPPTTVQEFLLIAFKN